jgi:hypothetical protein
VRSGVYVRITGRELLKVLTMNLVLQILQVGIGFVGHFVQLRVDEPEFLGKVLAQVLLVGAEDSSAIGSAVYQRSSHLLSRLICPEG